MSKLTIVTNNVPRNMLYGYELSEKERKEFDYISDEDFPSHDFFKYKGQIYDPSEFMRCPDSDEYMKKWDGYSSNTYFSGILIKYTKDMEQVIVGRYYS